MPTTQHDVIKIPLLFKASYTSYRKEVKDIISNENAPLQSFRIKGHLFRYSTKVKIYHTKVRDAHKTALSASLVI